MTLQFMIFILVAFSVYALINTYIYRRGRQGISRGSLLNFYFKPVFWIVVLAYPLGRLFERIWICWFSSMLIHIGAFWLGAMLYFFLFLIVLDLLRLFNYLFHIAPSLFKRKDQSIKNILFWSISFTVITLCAIGYWNAHHPRMQPVRLSINKEAGELDSLKIALITDIHMGIMIDGSDITGLVDQVNAMEPDIVLLGGDIVDEDVSSVLHNGGCEPFKHFQAPLGIFAISGNHEYIGGIDEAVPFIRNCGIHLLMDSVAMIDSSFYLIGRQDYSGVRFTYHPRKSMKELMSGIDKRFPLILLDHQPWNLAEAVVNGIDLQLSGHTHYGQLWPLNFLVRSLYVLSWGLKSYGQTHIYVSSGYGFWGPPMRLGNHPEWVLLTVYFKPRHP